MDGPELLLTMKKAQKYWNHLQKSPPRSTHRLARECGAGQQSIVRSRTITSGILKAAASDSEGDPNAGSIILHNNDSNFCEWSIWQPTLAKAKQEWWCSLLWLNITCQEYLELLREQVFFHHCTEEDIHFHSFSEHDRSLVHYGNIVPQLLYVHFPRKWIGRQRTVGRPPWSPNLIALDFFSGYMVYVVKIRDIDHIRECYHTWYVTGYLFFARVDYDWAYSNRDNSLSTCWVCKVSS